MDAGARPFPIWLFPLAVLAVAAALMMTDAGGVASRFAASEFDAFQQFRPRSYEDTVAKSGYAVRVLNADAASMARFGPWPWPRSVLARLCNEMAAAGAAIVVLDMPLDESDPASPARAGALLPDDPAMTSARQFLALQSSPDDALAAAMRKTRTVIGYELGERSDPGPQPQHEPAGDKPTATDSIPDFESADGAETGFARASADIGALNVRQGEGSATHGLPLLFRLKGRVVPSLDGAVLRLIAGSPNLTIMTGPGEMLTLRARPQIVGVSAGAYSVPLAPDGSLQIYFSGPQARRMVSAAALDTGTVAPGTLAKAVVYFGPPRMRLRTPDGPASIGEVRAEGLENILLGTALKSAAALSAQLLFLAVTGGALVFLFGWHRPVWAVGFALLAIGCAVGFSWFLFAGSHTLIASANVSLALLAAATSGLMAQGFDLSRRRARITESFGGMLSFSAAHDIARAPAVLSNNGESRVVTSLACGVRRAPELAQAFGEDSASFLRLLNAAMAPLVDDALSHGAMIGRFDGASFVAHWNAPLDEPEHAIQACEAAGRMTLALAAVNERLTQERRHDGTAFEPIEIGIGLSTARASAGTFHLRGRANYCVIGGGTILAEHIRLISDQYGPAVIASEDTRDAASRAYAFLEVDFIALGPRDEPVKLYALLGNPLVRASPKFRALATFHEHIFQTLRMRQWSKTRELIEQCRKLSGASQKIYDLHLARIAWFEANPPGPDWDGAFRAVLK
jgi:adenylate cyclase